VGDFVKAAQYLRTSTAHQNGALAYQRSIIQEYALRRGIEIVRTYADENKSGLDVAHRPGFCRLLRDVLARRPGFEAILVYDVTRWGRFLDADESAYYEYLCKSAGIKVHYCADAFTNEETPTAAIAKSLRRVMAGEYIRELSTRVWNAQRKVVESGFKVGGTAGYGLRRRLVGADGRSKGTLHLGEWKGASKDRVAFTHGPANEVAVVRLIFHLFVRKGRTIRQIVRFLRSRGPVREARAGWNFQLVYKILVNPKYTGCTVFNRTCKRFRSSGRTNPRELWVIHPSSFEPIVSQDLFNRAQLRFRQRTARRTNEELISELAMLLKSKGRLSEKLIKKSKNLAAPNTYRTRFGSLSRAYSLAENIMGPGS
jgi:DNA invertase Pin-like site-specific DNA recombinase